MCEKFDSSLFVFAAHSKKRPNNIVIGRLHDHEILDMYELGIENYKSMRSSVFLLMLVDFFPGYLFRGPKVSRVNSSGIEHVMHFIMPSENKLLLRVSGVKLRPSSKGSETDGSCPLTETLRAPWGPYVQVELQNSAPEVDFVLRRRLMPSEEKWKRACRVPAELRPKKEKFKNRSMDVFGSKVAQVHVHREHGLENLRPGASMRTALTGNVKRGFERRDAGADKLVVAGKSVKKRKHGEASNTNPSTAGTKRPRPS
ncbi:unnamed protein product [Schistocephalus solidus]|uniref:Ribosome production factor 2 homolog n=1 Tax=Schistocephalus solidus TaxID=70667 RepID=A0A183SEC2_SCHSO|nr:unnamed protein product [Schistocephalus solidus]